jgi:hypothetical protein
MKNALCIVFVLCIVCSFKTTVEKPKKIIESKVKIDSVQDTLIQYRLTEDDTWWEIKKFEFDSCEYFYIESEYRGGPTHKGNCKYCAARKARADSLKEKLKPVTKIFWSTND